MAIEFGTWAEHPLGEKLYVANLQRKGYSESDINYELRYYKGGGTPQIHQETAERFLGLLGGASPVAGASITGGELLRSAEQLAENVRATLEAVEKQPEANRKLVAQWRFALNCLIGATHKRGLIPDLKDAGPGAY